MKKRLLTTFLLAGFVSLQARCQDLIKQVSCSNDLIIQQADSVKQVFSSRGFIVVREATMTMESEFEMPVIMALTEGTWYQFVFIGEYSSKLYEVRMYDFDEHMVIFEKKRSGNIDANVITYSYIPDKSQYHMMKPVQVNKKKKKGLCGYVLLLKKVR